MATPKQSLWKLLRRSHPISTISRSYSYSSLSSSQSILSPQSSNHTTLERVLRPSPSIADSLAHHHYSFPSSRSLHTRDSENGGAWATRIEERSGLGFDAEEGGGDDGDIPDVAEALTSGASVAGDGSGGEAIFPVRAVISMLDSFHESTGLPWWVVIASSTLALRITLLPVLILQLQKSKKIAELLPKLPPPFPSPLSGTSFIDQFSLFRKEKRAIGCPSLLWFLASISVQVPCFLLWVTSICKMSLDHHPGFDCGGTLWFQNLTDLPHGVLGVIFPLLVAGLHVVNVQVSFRTSTIEKVTGRVGLLAKYYKYYLNILTLPILFAAFSVPQGSLVYWLTNSSLTLIQQLLLIHPTVRKKLGLPEKVNPVPAADREEIDTPEKTEVDLLRKQQKIPIQNMSPRELLAVSVQLLAKGHKDRAIPLLRLALHKDPDYVRVLVVLGQTLLQNGQLAEANEYFERAISKLFLKGHPAEVEEVDLLILASQWAGAACIRQGRSSEGIRHFERVANLKEPDDSKSKAHYYDALVLLASALYIEGRKTEAAKYLRRAVAYDPAYKVYLEQCENDDADFVSDLVSSRRADY